MKTEDFNYNLDESLIAQIPLEKRDQSKLMLVDKKSGIGAFPHPISSIFLQFLSIHTKFAKSTESKEKLNIFVSCTIFKPL